MLRRELVVGIELDCTVQWSLGAQFLELECLRPPSSSRPYIQLHSFRSYDEDTSRVGLGQRSVEAGIGRGRHVWPLVTSQHASPVPSIGQTTTCRTRSTCTRLPSLRDGKVWPRFRAILEDGCCYLIAGTPRSAASCRLGARDPLLRCSPGSVTLYYQLMKLTSLWCSRSIED